MTDDRTHVRTEAPTSDGHLLVQVGDVIMRGAGDQAQIVVIAWTNRSYVPGAIDAQGTPYQAPSARATPVDAVLLVPPGGDGQFSGTALRPEIMTYLGYLHYSDEETEAAGDDDYAAREGHTWRMRDTGWRHLENWWAILRQCAPVPAEADATNHN